MKLDRRGFFKASAGAIAAAPLVAQETMKAVAPTDMPMAGNAAIGALKRAYDTHDPVPCDPVEHLMGYAKEIRRLQTEGLAWCDISDDYGEIAHARIQCLKSASLAHKANMVRRASEEARLRNQIKRQIDDAADFCRGQGIPMPGWLVSMITRGVIE